MKKFVDTNHKKKIVVFSLLAVIVVICALTFAWFYNSRQLYTYAHVEKPSTLAIKGYNETTVEQISLSTVDLTDNSHKASFVFCVTGTNHGLYSLELAYTTNVPFIYTIRETSQLTEPPSSGDYLTYKDNTGQSYYYSTENDSLSGGEYVNKETSGNVAVVDGGTKDKHEYAYNQYDRENVQIHAEPVYYLFDNVPVRDTGTSEFVDYYILELTWDETVATTYQKETDLVYLLAANTSNS